MGDVRHPREKYDRSSMAFSLTVAWGLGIIHFVSMGVLWGLIGAKMSPADKEQGEMMKSVSLCRVVLAVILGVLFLLPGGCGSYEQPGETAAEGRRRHLRNARINQQEMMADTDRFMHYDQPSKLTDKRIP
jgi:hypothetical protein